MKRYTVAKARARLAEALDEAERGVPVVIERRGVRYTLRAEPPSRRRLARRKPTIMIVDPAIERGEWQWTWTPASLRFRPRRRRS